MTIPTDFTPSTHRAAQPLVSDSIGYVPVTLTTTLWGRLPSDVDEPVLSINSGQTVILDTISHEGILEDQGRDPVAFFGQYGVTGDQILTDAIDLAANGNHDPVDGPHVVTGPIYVQGAQPGDLLEVRIDRLVPRVPYGIVSSRHGRGLLPEQFPAEGELTSIYCAVDDLDLGVDKARITMPLRHNDDARPIEFPMAPFLGIMGVATPGARLHSTPPGLHGGNLDIRLLVEGATLYLPVQVPGAGFYVGDPHFAQGNGEVALTAVEASLRATLTIQLVTAADARLRFGAVTGPFARTPRFLVPTGLDEDLDVAVAKCGTNAVELLETVFGMAPELAYAYLSARTDFEISQVVDGVKGAHARICLADFAKIGHSSWF